MSVLAAVVLPMWQPIHLLHGSDMR